MKRIPGTILVECDLCFKVHPDTFTRTCPDCGLTICTPCAYVQSFKCLNCGSILGRSY